MVYGFLALIVVMSLGFLGDLVAVATIRERAETAIRALNAELEQRMAITTVMEGERALPAAVQVALYRIAQEALNNSVRHARANHARLELHGTPAQVTLRIQDDGCGFDPQTKGTCGFGLGNMHERASAIGAAFAILSRPGQGTEVRVIWSGT
jgi:signal transduction histidine kinase